MKYQKSNGSFGDYPHSFKQADLDSLLIYINELGFAYSGVIPMREALSGHPRAVVIRHDVDHNLDHAIKFAEWEHQHSIRSSYFILPSAWYYKDIPSLRSKLLYLESLGHEVGLHNNTVCMAQGDLVQASHLMLEQVAELRSMGLDIVGAADHGGSGYDNTKIWELHSFGFFGLQYEAYHLHRASHYISDNRGKWNAEFSTEQTKQVHILIHPCHWELP